MTVLTKTTTAAGVAQILINDWVIPYGIPEPLLTENEFQFAQKFSSTARTAMGAKLKRRVSYHLRTNGQSERYNKTIVSRPVTILGKIDIVGTRSSSPDVRI